MNITELRYLVAIRKWGSVTLLNYTFHKFPSEWFMVNYMKVATCVCKIISFVEIRHFITKYLCKSNTEIAAFVDNNKKKRQSL